MKCATCGHENEPGQVACVACGNLLAIANPPEPQCQHCGASISDGMKFCNGCGKPLQPVVEPKVTIPPVLAPPVPSTPLTPPQVASPKPKKSPAIAILLTVFFVCGTGVCAIGGFGFYRESHSGVFVDDQELSRSEVKRGIEELKALNNASASSTSLMAVPTTSKFSKKFQDLLARILIADEKLSVDLDLVKADKIISDQLATADGRAASVVEQHDIDTMMRKYFDSESAALTQLDTFIAKIFGPQGKTVPIHFTERLSEVSQAYWQFSKCRQEIIEFTGKVKVTKDGGKLLFYRSADLKAFNDLAAKHDLFMQAFSKSTVNYKSNVEKESHAAFQFIEENTPD